MRILILGAGGFIGSNLVEHLARSERTYDVVGVDVSAEKLEEVETGDHFRFHECDFNAPAAQAELLRADVVIDLVAYANPSVYVESPLDTFRLNFLQNLEIVEQCVSHRKRLIQYSTCEVYGRPTGPTYREDDSELVCGPVAKHRWIYASGKQLLERVIHAYGLEGRLEYSVIRPFNFIGPRFDYLVPAGNLGGPRVFAQFMSALLTGGPMFLVNGGGQHRSFTHIDDANRGLEAILHHPGARNQVFNVGNPDNDISIRELALTMIAIYMELTGEPVVSQLVDIDGEEFYGPGYEDHTRVPADITKLSNLGWAPRHDLRSSLRATMAHYVAAASPDLSLTAQA
ncbi:MAG: NAD-dependent epimerase/dehydratase family protein [Acidimicrobiia bacterium]|nr:NAD-dependent epimerase/dehydratase family protein [Acidimicrobiia bacterium]MDH5314771.1 NAD-dependent epimerase/dehydratase family protein [Actinomycetota bacterium]